MAWNSQYVIFRFGSESGPTQVYAGDDLKQIKYWLTYIAEVGDMLCRTPLHPKHSKASQKPEYFQHKEQSGKPSSELELFQRYLEMKKFTLVLPEDESVASGG